jgi:hypothetical protein
MSQNSKVIFEGTLILAVDGVEDNRQVVLPRLTIITQHSAISNEY